MLNMRKEYSLNVATDNKEIEILILLFFTEFLHYYSASFCNHELDRCVDFLVNFFIIAK